jgi:hypothetical protein
MIDQEGTDLLILHVMGFFFCHARLITMYLSGSFIVDLMMMGWFNVSCLLKVDVVVSIKCRYSVVYTDSVNSSIRA